MDKTEKITFNTTLLLTIVIIVSTLLIFILTPSPISPTKVLFGYITGVYTQNNTAYIQFDRAEWFTDTEKNFAASIACKNDGNEKCSKCTLPIDKPCVHNGYYIRNPEPDIKTYPVMGLSKVGTLILNPDWDSQNPDSSAYQTLTLSQFLDIYQNPSSPYSYIKTAPFDITVIAGQVIIINQHYIP